MTHKPHKSFMVLPPIMSYDLLTQSSSPSPITKSDPLDREISALIVVTRMRVESIPCGGPTIFGGNYALQSIVPCQTLYRMQQIHNQIMVFGSIVMPNNFTLLYSYAPINVLPYKNVWTVQS